jgi:cytochrome c
MQINLQNALKLAVSSLLLVTAQAYAQAPAATPKAAAVPTDAQADKIIEERYCSGCHDMAKKVLGPSFNDITKKYAEGDKKANAEKLSTAIRKGGKGVWGTMAMPANAAITDDELKTISSWLVNRTVK